MVVKIEETDHESRVKYQLYSSLNVCLKLQFILLSHDWQITFKSSKTPTNSNILVDSIMRNAVRGVIYLLIVHFVWCQVVDSQADDILFLIIIISIITWFVHTSY